MRFEYIAARCQAAPSTPAPTPCASPGRGLGRHGHGKHRCPGPLRQVSRPAYGIVYAFATVAHTPHSFYQSSTASPRSVPLRRASAPSGAGIVEASDVDQGSPGGTAHRADTTVQAHTSDGIRQFHRVHRPATRRLDAVPGERSRRGRHPGHRRRRRRVHRLPVVRHRRRRVGSGARARQPGWRVSAIRCPATHRDSSLRGQLAVPGFVHVVSIDGHRRQRIPHKRHVLLDESLRVRRQSGE